MSGERTKMKTVLGNVAAAAAAVVLYGAWPAVANATDGVADFYHGKTVTLLVPSAPGGGYDTYARLVGRFIGEHIPGKPAIVVQNMPGGGGLTEVNYLYNVAPKDGSTIAIIMHGTIFDPVLDPREVRYKIDGFRWLGSVTPITVIGIFRKDAPARTVAELFDREVIIGGSGGTTVYLPQAVNSVLHTKMKLVMGYGGTNNILLAMARAEVSGVVGIGLDGLRGFSGAGNIDDYNILFQMGTARSRNLPDVPLIQEFAKSDEDREVLETICASCSIGWVFVAPAISDDRYAALRAAFEATVKDPAFVAQAQKQYADVDYVSPDKIEKIVGHVYSRARGGLEARRRGHRGRARREIVDRGRLVELPVAAARRRMIAMFFGMGDVRGERKMKTTLGNVAAAAAALVLYGAWPATANATDGVADFYRGKTVTLLTPDAAGSGYDAYARLVGRFIGEHIPGKPTIVVQNMPGGGGLIEMNYLYNMAPKDGSAIAIIMHGTIFDPIFDPRQVQYKIDALRWLGSVTPITVIGAFRKDAPARTVGDLFDHEVIIGGSGGTTVYLPLAVNSILHTEMKLVRGYRSTNDILLAMARKEISGVVGIGFDSLQTEKAGGDIGNYNILFQMGMARSRRLPDVPLIQEFAKSDEDREVLEAVFASFSIGRVFITPAIPDDRYAALQAAFEATVEDPAFVAQAQKQHSDVGYVSPDEIQKIVDHVYGQPAAVSKRAAAAIQSGH